LKTDQFIINRTCYEILIPSIILNKTFTLQRGKDLLNITSWENKKRKEDAKAEFILEEKKTTNGYLLAWRS
jgi:hypothetical protein